LINKKYSAKVIPIEREDFWDYDLLKEDFLKYHNFRRQMKIEAEYCLEDMVGTLVSFFNISQESLDNTLPKIDVSNTIAGGTAAYMPRSNHIEIPIKYALPYFLGQTKDLRETNFFHVLAHEIGHYLFLTSLTQGNLDKFSETFMGLRWEAEFFARICQRLISDKLQICLKNTQESEFEDDDEHIAFVYADKFYESIINLSLEERSQLAIKPELLKKYNRKN